MNTRWRKPDEVREPGLYVFTRTDDDIDEPGTVLLKHDGHGVGYEDKGVCWSYITNWDEECRFFGPIPAYDEPKRTFPSQRALKDQLIDAIVLCNRNMLYDAADWIRDRALPETKR